MARGEIGAGGAAWSASAGGGLRARVTRIAGEGLELDAAGRAASSTPAASAAAEHHRAHEIGVGVEGDTQGMRIGGAEPLERRKR